MWFADELCKFLLIFNGPTVSSLQPFKQMGVNSVWQTNIIKLNFGLNVLLGWIYYAGSDGDESRGLQVEDGRGGKEKKENAGAGGGGALPPSGLLHEITFRCQSPREIRKLCGMPLIFAPQYPPTLLLLPLLTEWSALH